MKLVTVITMFGLATIASAETLDVSGIIHSFYPKSPPNIPASQSTALASALQSVDSSLRKLPEYTPAHEAVVSAAPTSVQASMSVSGYYYEKVITQAWYTENVPKAAQSEIKLEISALSSAIQSVVPTKTSKGGVGKATGAALAGVVGMVGILVAM